MPRVNEIAIDARGNMEVELSCYEGGRCEMAEEDLRRALEELGVAVTTKNRRRKSPEEIRSEARSGLAHKDPSEVSE